MLKNMLLVFCLMFSLAYGVDKKEMDNQKVEKALNQMIKSYKNKNLKVFVSHILENKFQGDFLDFVEEVQNDMRVNTVMSIDVWVDKITTDGKKRFLYITWNKIHTSIEMDGEITTDGKSMLLFQKSKKRYGLIDFKGAPLFGNK